MQTDRCFFFDHFDHEGAKKKLGKKKAPMGDFAVCGRHAAFLEKVGENF